MRPSSSFSLVAALAFSVVVTGARANNISVTDVALKGQNPAANLITIQFDLAWENSWRSSGTPANWDAAWVFASLPGSITASTIIVGDEATRLFLRLRVNE